MNLGIFKNHSQIDRTANSQSANTNNNSANMSKVNLKASAPLDTFEKRSANVNFGFKVSNQVAWNEFTKTGGTAAVNYAQSFADRVEAAMRRGNPFKRAAEDTFNQLKAGEDIFELARKENKALTTLEQVWEKGNELKTWRQARRHAGY